MIIDYEYIQCSPYGAHFGMNWWRSYLIINNNDMKFESGQDRVTC